MADGTRVGVRVDVDVADGAAVAAGSAEGNGTVVSPPAWRLHPTSRSAIQANASAFRRKEERMGLCTVCFVQVLHVVLGIYRPRTTE